MSAVLTSPPPSVARRGRLDSLGEAAVMLQPFLFALAVVIVAFEEVPSPPTAIVRPVVVVLLLTAALLVVMILVTRGVAVPALGTSSLMLFSLGELLMAAAVGVVVLWWGVIGLGRRFGLLTPGGPRRFAWFPRASLLFSAALFAVSTVTAVVAEATGRPNLSVSTPATDGAGGPNVYLILLDGYPRADSLAETFGFDNGEFIGDLVRREFVVANDARSNYRTTRATLASMLNGAYLDDLLAGQEVPANSTEQIRWLRSMINEASLLDVFRQRGYRTVSVPPGFASGGLWEADEVIEVGQFTEIETHLIGSSPWLHVFRDQFDSLFAGAHRAATAGTLEATVRLAEASPTRPQFVLSHVLSPHPPFVLGESSANAPHLPACYPRSCGILAPTLEESGLTLDEYRSRFGDQVEALNELIIAALDRIVVADPTAVIILLSDHGARYSTADRDEHFRVLMAARGGDGQLIRDDESPVNVLRRVVTTQFGTSLDRLPYEAWWSDPSHSLGLSRLEPDE
jgi:Sulfatase